MNIVPECMCVYHVHAWFLCRSEENTGSPGTVVIYGGVSMCVLGNDPGSSARAASALTIDSSPQHPSTSPNTSLKCFYKKGSISAKHTLSYYH